jgi:hypothetical protein
MSRRFSRTVATVLLTLCLVLQAPSAFAVPVHRGDDPAGIGWVTRIVRVIKHVVKGLVPAINDETSIWPTPPKP